VELDFAVISMSVAISTLFGDSKREKRIYTAIENLVRLVIGFKTCLTKSIVYVPSYVHGPFLIWVVLHI
jgi:hypothetical protein